MKVFFSPVGILFLLLLLVFQPRFSGAQDLAGDPIKSKIKDTISGLWCEPKESSQGQEACFSKLEKSFDFCWEHSLNYLFENYNISISPESFKLGDGTNNIIEPFTREIVFCLSGGQDL